MTGTPQIDLAVDAKNHLGETPVWSPAEQALYWVNCEQPPELLRWHPASGETRRWPMPKRIGGFAFKQGGGALVVLSDGLYDFDFVGEPKLRVRSPLPAGVSLHECRCDPTGRFWVGSINDSIGPGNLFPGGGALLRLDGDVLLPVIEDISCANGLAFAPDGRTLYFTDSPTGRCDRWDVDPATGAISNRRPLIELGADEALSMAPRWMPAAAIGRPSSIRAACDGIARTARWMSISSCPSSIRRWSASGARSSTHCSSRR